MTSVYNGPSFIHVGYIKTATTFLQRNVFSCDKYGFALGGGSKSRAHLISEFVVNDDYIFDPVSVTQRINLLEQEQRNNGLIPVWSDETLLGNPITRSYNGYAVALKLSKLQKPIKILITIREQCSLCLSAYREFIKQGGSHGLEDFIGSGREAISFTPILRPDYLMYDRAISFYASAFGKDNILVLPQEMLERDPSMYFSMLSDFVSVSIKPTNTHHRENTGLGCTVIKLYALLNRMSVKSPLSPRKSIMEKLNSRSVFLADKLIPLSVDRMIESGFARRISERYDSQFSASNRATEKIIDMDLKIYGYK